MIVTIVAGFLLITSGIVILRLVQQKRREAKAKTWPSAQATVQMGTMEVVFKSRSVTMTLPCFAFSYVVNGEYYVGRFALGAKGEKAARLVREMEDRTFLVHYDPENPTRFYLPYQSIEGSRLKQPLKPHFIALYPQN